MSTEPLAQHPIDGEDDELAPPHFNDPSSYEPEEDDDAE
jgi:hypothetical protein